MSAGKLMDGTKRRWISQGGGNSNGHSTVAYYTKWTQYINEGKFSGYYGIVFDPEEGDAGLCASLTGAVSAARAKGLKTMVTVPHQQPYGIPDAKALMKCIFAMDKLDYLSPQFYTSGLEATVDYQLSNGQDGTTQWADYVTSRALLVPSVSYGCHYTEVQNFFKNLGVTTGGYMAWTPGCLGGGGTAPSGTAPSAGLMCGTAWNVLGTKSCPGGLDSECPAGQNCWRV